MADVKYTDNRGLQMTSIRDYRRTASLSLITWSQKSELRMETVPIPQGHGEAARGKMEKKEAVSIPGFFLLHLHTFPEPHCSIQPALLLPTSESCPRPGHVTWLAATDTHGDLKRERDI
jgi:hypothetical protein